LPSYALKQRFKLPKKEFLFLILLISFAVILRVWDLGMAGFNNDEAIYSGQAATLAGNDEFEKHFSIFRAHPLLLQTMVSVIVGMFGVNDTVSRIVPAILGILTVIITYIIGKILFDTKVAMVSAIVITILPYHILLSRQVLLDVSLAFFYTLTLYFMARHLKNPKNALWVYLIGASAGLGFLSKEIGIFALITSILGLLLIRTISFRNVLIVISSFLLASSPYWIPILIVPEAHETAVKYWNWQRSRDPNQSDLFYVTLISQEALGYVLTALCVISTGYAIKTGSIKSPKIFLLLLWIAIPLVLFHFLAVKGFAFVLPLIPAFVLLGISVLFSDWMKKLPGHRILVLGIIPLIFVFSGSPLHYLLPIPPVYLVGSGEESHAKEGALWIKNNISPAAKFLTLDIRTANIIKFYSNNEAFALYSNQNPAYTQADNPDLAILSGQINYLVYDIYLAERLRYLQEEQDELTELVAKYNGIPVHTEYETVFDKNGHSSIRPALIIYSLNTNEEK
jgi:4-amino-4-deoxy-L-arabinose transferase-like glycosyltransferase